MPRPARRLVIRRLLETSFHPGATLADVGAAIDAASWLEPSHLRHIAVVIGKIPVRWTAEDRVVSIEVYPAPPGDPDRHRLLIYLRVAGQPPLDDIVAGLRGGPAGADLEVLEIGFFEMETPAPAAAASPPPPVLDNLVLCRRALFDAATGMHTLVDLLIDLAVAPLPGAATFDVYLQLRRIAGDATLVVEVSDPDGALLTSGTLSLGAAPGAPRTPPPPSLGVAIPNITVTFARAGEHRLRVRCNDQLLGEHRFDVVAGAPR